MSKRYRVEYTDDAFQSLRAITGRSRRKKIASRLDALEIFPQMGVAYDPPYDAMIMVNHTLLVTYAGDYGIYFTVDEAACLVTIEHIEDQRANPANRFGGFAPREEL